MFDSAGYPAVLARMTLKNAKCIIKTEFVDHEIGAPRETTPDEIRAAITTMIMRGYLHNVEHETLRNIVAWETAQLVRLSTEVTRLRDEVKQLREGEGEE